MNKDKLEVFMDYLKEQFPGCIEDHFTYDLIKNLIDYVYREHGHTKNSARAIIASILPEVTYEELEAYLPDFDEWEANYDKDVILRWNFRQDKGKGSCRGIWKTFNVPVWLCL